MSLASPVRVSLLPVLIRFAIVFVSCVAIAQLIVAFVDFSVPGATGIIIFMIALSPAFVMFAKATGRVMNNGEKFRFSLGAAFIAIGVNVTILLATAYIAIGSASPNEVAMALGIGKIDLSVIAIILGGGFLLAFLVSYFSAGFMGRRALKRFASQAVPQSHKP